jgi:hypothetical protein
MQERTIKYNTGQYNTTQEIQHTSHKITYITQDNSQYAKLPKIKNTYYTLIRLRNE